MAETFIPQFDDVRIVYNPTREGAEQQAERCVDRLRGWLADSVTIDTLPSAAGGGQPNAKILGQEVRPGRKTALGLWTGDGTYKDFIGATQEPEMAELLPDLSITSMNEGGNACDIGTSLHGFFTKDPRKIFGRRLRAVQAFALQCSIETLEGDVIEHYASSYLGAGKSALASATINGDSYKNGPAIWRDAGIVVDTLTSGHRFQLLANDIHYEFSDLTYWKGRHMAKLAQAGVGPHAMNVWKRGYHVTPVAGDRASGVYAAAMLPFGAAAGFDMTEPTHFTTASEVFMHFDGDKPIVVPDYSNVTIGLAPQPYTVLTTRLA
jgi:hypothetical protein